MSLRSIWLPSGLSALLISVCTGCATLSGTQERYVACPYEQVWDAALDTVKDRAVATQDREQGIIQTTWLEVPMEGRTFGVLRREIKDSRDRSRVFLNLTRMGDVTQISFLEERERWAFRGGSRLFGWVPTEPSETVMKDFSTRLAAKLKEQGCSAT